jgi:protein-S-isoprenylcysteine O-methyltransferase Ste14
MVSFWILLLAMGVYGVLHSVTASLRFKNQVRRLFGSGMERWYRLVYSLMGVVSFIPVLILFIILPDRILYSVPTPWSWFLLFVQMIGVLILLWSLLVIDVWAFLGLKQLSGDTQTEDSLTTAGPYRLVRHPLYTGSLLVIWFMPQMSLNLLAFNLGVTAYLVIGGYFEERKLVRQFGRVYEEYRRRTPMLIPWSWRRRQPE